MKNNKKIFILSIVLLLIVMLTSCAKKMEVSDNVEKEIIEETMQTTKESVDETLKIETISDNKKETEEIIKEKDKKDKKGKYMLIKLKTNPTTGFDFVWNIKEESETYVNLEDTFTENNNDKHLVGGAIHRTYVFNAENCDKGNVTLDFDYMRNWPGGENAYHVYYDIKVNKDNTISFVKKWIEEEMIQADIDDFDDPYFVDEYNVKKEDYEEEPED